MTHSRTPDRRIVRTRRNIQNALAQLMQTKSVEDITVKELVTAADINRSTFYLHYQNIEDLLEHTEDDIHAQLKAAVSSSWEDNNPFSLACCENYFSFVCKYSSIIQALIGTHGDFKFVTEIVEGCIDYLVKNIAEREEVTLKKEARLVFYYGLMGLLGITRNWLAFGCSEEAVKDVARIAYVAIRPIFAEHQYRL